MRRALSHGLSAPNTAQHQLRDIPEELVVKDLYETMDVAAKAAHSGASIFAHWDAVAGVRKDEALIQEDRLEVFKKRFFPSEIVPHLQHPLVLELDYEARRYLEAQHLFQWLLFTVQFELKFVNPAVLNIAEDSCASRSRSHNVEMR
jgi:hypothetical protein